MNEYSYEYIIKAETGQLSHKETVQYKKDIKNNPDLQKKAETARAALAALNIAAAESNTDAHAELTDEETILLAGYTDKTLNETDRAKAEDLLISSPAFLCAYLDLQRDTEKMHSIKPEPLPQELGNKPFSITLEILERGFTLLSHSLQPALLTPAAAVRGESISALREAEFDLPQGRLKLLLAGNTVTLQFSGPRPSQSVKLLKNDSEYRSLHIPGNKWEIQHLSTGDYTVILDNITIAVFKIN